MKLPPSSLDPTVRGWLWIVMVVTVVMALALLLMIVITKPEAAQRLDYWKFYLAALKFILAGFFVACLGLLIPKGLAESRQSFERFKESLVAYSRAKTGVDYLCLRLCALPLKEASAHIQRIHVWKHRAQLYPELRMHLQQREETMEPLDWADQLYEQLHAVRDELEANASSWDKMPMNERLDKLHQAQERGLAKWNADMSAKKQGPGTLGAPPGAPAVAPGSGRG